MSQNVNCATTTPETLAMFSMFNSAYRNVCNIRSTYASLIKVQNDALKAVLASRDNALKDGKSQSEVETLYPRLAIDNEIRRLENERNEALKPYTEDIKTCVSKLPATLVPTFKYAIECMDAKKTPSANTTVKIGKSEYGVSRSLMAELKDLALTWGFGKAGNDTAIGKFADALLLLTPATQKDNKGNYIKAKTSAQIAEGCLLATILFAIKRGAWEETDDLEIVIKKYDEE